MKKEKIIAFVATAALAATLGLAGCGGGQAASSAAASSAAASASAASAAASSAADATSASAAAASPSAAASAAAPAASTAAASAQNPYIGEDAAMDIALADAGLGRADVTELKAELDLDDAVVHYDVDFKSGGMEYDYDIDATTGAVLTSKSEVDD